MTIDSMDVTLLTGLIFIAATLYSSVGHGGASGYLAAMAFFTVPAAVMKPTALLLNVLVSGIGVVRFYRFKLLRLQNLWPFIVGSIPCAFIGGGIHLPESFYRPLLGLCSLLRLRISCGAANSRTISPARSRRREALLSRAAAQSACSRG